jgi:hypothetical protein
MLFPFNLLIILNYCICLSAKRTVIGISIIEVIAIIVIFAYDIFVTTVVPDDDHVQGSQEPSLDLPTLPADRSNFDVHGFINTDQVWILLSAPTCDMPVIEIIVMI